MAAEKWHLETEAALRHLRMAAGVGGAWFGEWAWSGTGRVSASTRSRRRGRGRGPGPGAGARAGAQGGLTMVMTLAGATSAAGPAGGGRAREALQLTCRAARRTQAHMAAFSRASCPPRAPAPTSASAAPPFWHTRFTQQLAA